jgi:uncharacterized SAM-binding protein YcdF (DUF218 family)
LFLALSKLLDLLLAPLTWTALLVVAGFALRRRRPAVAWALALLGAVELVVFSTPSVADAIMRRAERAAPRTWRPDQTYDVVIVLGGVVELRPTWMDDGKDLNGAAERITRAFELLHAGRARDVLLSGGVSNPAPGEPAESEQLAAMLREWGVPPERIVVETRSRNTRENAVESARVVADRGWKRLLLVTSAMRMPRALGCFRRVGLSPDALPVDYRAGAPGSAAGFESWWPRAAELEMSTDALRELAGRVVYRVKGYSRE